MFSLSLTITIHFTFWHFFGWTVGFFWGFFFAECVLTATCDASHESQCSSGAVVVGTLKAEQYNRCVSCQPGELNRAFVVNDSSTERGQLHLRLLLGLISGRLMTEEGRQPRVGSEDSVSWTSCTSVLSTLRVTARANLNVRGTCLHWVHECSALKEVYMMRGIHCTLRKKWHKTEWAEYSVTESSAKFFLTFHHFLVISTMIHSNAQTDGHTTHTSLYCSLLHVFCRHCSVC